MIGSRSPNIVPQTEKTSGSETVSNRKGKWFRDCLKGLSTCLRDLYPFCSCYIMKLQRSLMPASLCMCRCSLSRSLLCFPRHCPGAYVILHGYQHWSQEHQADLPLAWQLFFMVAKPTWKFHSGHQKLTTVHITHTCACSWLNWLPVARLDTGP